MGLIMRNNEWSKWTYPLKKDLQDTMGLLIDETRNMLDTPSTLSCTHGVMLKLAEMKRAMQV